MADDATPTATLADEFFAALEHVAKERRALCEQKGGVVFFDDPDFKPCMDSLLRYESAAARLFARHPREKEEFESWLQQTGYALWMEATGTFADSPYEKPSDGCKRELAEWRKLLSGEPRPPVPQIPNWRGYYPENGITSLADVASYVDSQLGSIRLIESNGKPEREQGLCGDAFETIANVRAALAVLAIAPPAIAEMPDPKTPLLHLTERLRDLSHWARTHADCKHLLPEGAEIMPHDLDERAHGERNAVWAASMRPVVQDWRLVQREPLPERGRKNLSLDAHYPEWPHIKHLACEKFGHAEFSEDTLAALFTFLQGKLNISSNEAWELPRGRVASLLRGVPAAPQDDNVTLKEFAKLVYRSDKTLKQGFKPLPPVTKAGRGRIANEFSYCVLREWAIQNKIPTADTLANSLAEARANYDRQSVSSG